MSSENIENMIDHLQETQLAISGTPLPSVNAEEQVYQTEMPIPERIESSGTLPDEVPAALKTSKPKRITINAKLSSD